MVITLKKNAFKKINHILIRLKNLNLKKVKAIKLLKKTIFNKNLKNHLIVCNQILNIMILKKTIFLYNKATILIKNKILK